MTPLLRFYHQMLGVVRPNLAARHPTQTDPRPLTKQRFDHEMEPFGAGFVPYEAFWELHLLGVDPQFQGKGVGRALIEDGLGRAKEDGLPAMVVCAVGLEGIYQRCGFPVLLGLCSEVEVEGLSNPLKDNGLGGGDVLWTEVPVGWKM